MDINSIRDQVSNLTLYDLKAGVRKVQNAVMNYTEMEAKVREATNNEPWGASSTIMQDIANGTHSYQLLNEIMPMIYKRFTEKAAEEWRQIYKALQLLEFLIKNGSERVIDDARSHISLLKMLRQFHYIDQNGKDQGINVRNRSKELGELLGDVDRIRSERKKARANRNKFGGVEGGAMGGSSGGGSRYGGFGSEEAGYGGYSGGVYGDGGGFGGREESFQASSSRRDRFEEYDEHDEGGSSAAARKRPDAAARTQEKAEPPKTKEPAVDFLSFDDDVPPKTPPKDSTNIGVGASTSFGNGLGSLGGNSAEDDDFDDFQSATPSTSTASKPSIPPSYASGITSPMSTVPGQSANIGNLSGLSSPPLNNPISRPTPSSITSSSNIASPPAPNYNISMSAPVPQPAQPTASTQSQVQPQRPAGTNYQASAPNYFTSVATSQSPQSTSTIPAGGARPAISSTNSFSGNKPVAAKPATSGGDAFGSLWSSASSTAGIKKSTTGAGSSGPNLASLQREKASQGLWGHSAAPSSGTSTPGATLGGGAAPAQKSGGAFDDLLG